MTQTDDPETALPAPEDALPLTPASYHILLALVGQERHGYSIMREVEAYTQGSIRLGATTLYRSIKQMLAAHLIEEAEEASRASGAVGVEAGLAKHLLYRVAIFRAKRGGM